MLKNDPHYIRRRNKKKQQRHIIVKIILNQNDTIFRLNLFSQTFTSRPLLNDDNNKKSDTNNVHKHQHAYKNIVVDWNDFNLSFVVLLMQDVDGESQTNDT